MFTKCAGWVGMCFLVELRVNRIGTAIAGGDEYNYEYGHSKEDVLQSDG